MKLTQLIERFYDINQRVWESEIENDPMGFEADALLQLIETTQPEDVHEVAALAKLARFIAEVEEDPFGAEPILNNISAWASATRECGEGRFVQRVSEQPVPPRGAPAKAPYLRLVKSDTRPQQIL